MSSHTSQRRNRIKCLTADLAEKIAAGEVIERPASVIKELTENALDAGATRISVNLTDGGKALIEVCDNGIGMGPEDLKLCIRQHATSKISTLQDLERIRTLGFRGEALSSIGAVSELTLLSRPEEEDPSSPTAWVFQASQETPEPVTHGHFLGSHHGTLVRVEGLFSQIPARLKFLKSASSEITWIRDWIEKLSLANPQCGFELIHEGKVLFSLKPASRSFRIMDVLGDGADYPLIEERLEGTMQIHACWLQGLSLPQTRKLVQIINGRVIRDRLVMQAILRGFEQTLMPGKFPALALFLDLDPSELDVNVHPAKAEVRFLNSQAVFRQIEQTIRMLIRKSGAPGVVPGHGPVLSSDFAPRTWNASESMPAFSSRMPLSREATSAIQRPLDLSPTVGFPHEHYRGILFNTYLLFDLGEEAALIDQHAAHERIRYERLKKRFFGTSRSSLSSQSLMLPEAVKFPSEARGKVELGLEQLSRLGFEVELFGEDMLAFRSIPEDWGHDALAARLKNLIERLIEVESSELTLIDDRVFERLALEACHGSVRAGDPLTREKALHIHDELFRCEHPWNCPHGRPTVVRVLRAQFEEWFFRKL